MTDRTSVIHVYLFIVNLLSYNEVKAYHAVVLIHGVLTGSTSMELIKNRIQEMHPGTPIYNTVRFAGWSSLEPMWQQVEELGTDVISIGAAYPEGINLIGYSQGGLLGRAILQRFPMHNVRNFISLSSPQAGQYGAQFLHLIFPDLVCETAYELFYSRIGQYTSIANYWNDPYHQKLYHKYSKFLPFVNNEFDTFNNSDYKTGVAKLKNMILIGGPDDGVVTPWQSSHFGFFDNNGTVIDMHDRSIYTNDTIGLKTLDEQGKLKMITVPGVRHTNWHTNVSIIDRFLLPYLD